MKSTFFLVIFVALALTAYWNHRLHLEQQANRRALERAQQEADRLEHDIINSRNQTQLQIEAEKKAIRDDDLKISQLQTKIASLRGRLGGMNDVPLGGNNPSTLKWDIQHQKELVSDLERQQKILRGEEGDIKQRKNLVQNQDRAARTQSESAMQNQIQTQEQNLRAAQGRLLQARRDRSAYDVVQALQRQVNDQQTFVNQLKAQRQNLHQQWNQSVNQTQGQAQAALGEVKSDEQILSERLELERSHLRDLERSLSGDEKTANQYKSERSKAQNELQSDQSEILRLQNERDGHQRRLSTLQ